MTDLRSSSIAAAAVVLAACAGASPSSGPSATPPSPSASASASASPSASASAPAGTAATSPAPSASATPATAPPPSGPMRTVAPSEMGAALKELGLDPAALPPLNKIPPDKIRKVMGTFTKTLGTKCSGCHDEDDFKKPTPNKKIAARMWNDYVRGYTIDGKPVYCDSCHGGKKEFLVRDPGLKTLSTWMDENFDGKLKKKSDGQAPSCETCHGDPMEGKFLAAWAK